MNREEFLAHVAALPKHFDVREVDGAIRIYPKGSRRHRTHWRGDLNFFYALMQIALPDETNFSSQYPGRLFDLTPEQVAEIRAAVSGNPHCGVELREQLFERLAVGKRALELQPW